MNNKVLLSTYVSKDMKQVVINQKLNDLVREVKKLVAKKDVVIMVCEKQ